MEIELTFNDLKPEIQDRLIEDLMERLKDFLEIEAEKKGMNLIKYVYKTFNFNEYYTYDEFKKRFEYELEDILEDVAIDVLADFKFSTYLEINNEVFL